VEAFANGTAGALSTSRLRSGPDNGSRQYRRRIAAAALGCGLVLIAIIFI
jgi:hypothetical protein